MRAVVERMQVEEDSMAVLRPQSASVNCHMIGVSECGADARAPCRAEAAK